ncbi:hypothetical protein DP117_17775 [Brasilonema sp. UFV-L1]|uniref:transposase n=1 Tax=Brasilonema sp. UFV-L1 TaxID=2234130 RepID=UPI0016A4A075|nr:hypothetical protein [Brasilonema sp. UFV-L1]
MQLRLRRLLLRLKILQTRSFKLILDETGDKKKGNSMDDVSRQYIGNLGAFNNGIVSVNTYGILGNITFPLIFKIFKPRKKLKETEESKTKS